MNPIHVALIAASASILVAVIAGIFQGIISPFFGLIKEWLFQSWKLRSEWKLEQRKEIRRAIAKMQQELAYRGEQLNKRFWNLRGNAKERWLDVNGDFNNPRKHYFQTTVFRFSTFYCASFAVEDKVSFLDTRIGLDEDVKMLKMLKFLQQIPCDAMLFTDTTYDKSKESSHIFAENLRKGALVNLSDGKNVDNIETIFGATGCVDKIQSICCFFDGYLGDRHDIKTTRIYFTHLSLIVFLNIFGYDWQKTSNAKIKTLIQNSNIDLHHYKEFFSAAVEMKLGKEFKFIEKFVNKIYSTHKG